MLRRDTPCYYSTAKFYHGMLRFTKAYITLHQDIKRDQNATNATSTNSEHGGAPFDAIPAAIVTLFYR